LISILLTGTAIIALWGSQHEHKGVKIVERSETDESWDKMT